MSVNLIKIPHDLRGRFVRRLNRFVGEVKTAPGRIELVHIHDPGRLTEILFEGNEVLLARVDNPARKTRWDLLAGRVGDQWVLVHSGYHRAVAEKIFEMPEVSPFGTVVEIHPEVKYGSSRLDFLIRAGEEQIWIEVKGCTLARDGVALFPDAPTSRGRRHMEELIALRGEGFRSAAVFLVFVSAEVFAPNAETDPDFAEVFYRAVRAGVEIYPLRLCYDGENVCYVGRMPFIRGD